MISRLEYSLICLENVIFIGYISIYNPHTLVAIQMVAMATRKMIYTYFHGNGQSYASLFGFVGPKYT